MFDVSVERCENIMVPMPTCIKIVNRLNGVGQEAEDIKDLAFVSRPFPGGYQILIRCKWVAPNALESKAVLLSKEGYDLCSTETKQELFTRWAIGYGGAIYTVNVLPEKKITKEELIQVYQKGIVRLITSPNGDGIVAEIGDGWFYFGGLTAEQYTSISEYMADIPQDDIIQSIFDALESFREPHQESFEEYVYYASTIKGALDDCAQADSNTLVAPKTQ